MITEPKKRETLLGVFVVEEKVLIKIYEKL
jgi:hypothetical protein